MGKYCQIVIGPAGSGKSTYCFACQQHFALSGRTSHIFNFDPASEDVPYTPAIDLRDLVTTADIMEYCDLGPNGSLVYALEYALKDPEQQSWLTECLADFEDDYIIIDFAGQIELFTHYNCVYILANELRKQGYTVCCVYVLEGQKFCDASAYLSSVLVALSALTSCGCAFLALMSKIDLLTERQQQQLDVLGSIDGSTICDLLCEDTLFGVSLLREDEATATDTALPVAQNPAARAPTIPPRRKILGLSRAIQGLLHTEGSLSFIPYSPLKPDTLHHIAGSIDFIMNYGEDEEPREPCDIGCAAED